MIIYFWELKMTSHMGGGQWQMVQQKKNHRVLHTWNYLGDNWETDSNFKCIFVILREEAESLKIDHYWKQ